MHKDNGFTLIEILVVLVIISITTSFALLAFGDYGTKRRAQITAEQFSGYLKLIQQHAILENADFAVRITEEGYKTYRLGVNQKWQIISNSFYHRQKFPSGIIVHSEMPAKRNSFIIIRASGDITPFKLNFGTPQRADLATLQELSIG